MPKKTRREEAVAKAAAKLQSFDDWREDKRGKKPKKKKKPDATRRKMEKMHKQDQPLPHQLDKDKGSKKKPKGPSPSAVKARAKAATKALTKKAKEAMRSTMVDWHLPDPGFGNWWVSHVPWKDAQKYLGTSSRDATYRSLKKDIPPDSSLRSSPKQTYRSVIALRDMLPTSDKAKRMAEEHMKKKEKAKADAKRKAKAKKGKDTTPSKGRAPVE